MQIQRLYNTVNKLLLWVAVFMALLIALCGAKSEDMTISMRADPRIQVFHQPWVNVDTSVTVKNPTKALSCISLAYAWGDKEVSKWEPSCDDPDWKPTMWTEYRNHRYKRHGKYTITVYFYHGNNLYWKESAVVEILGGD